MANTNYISRHTGEQIDDGIDKVNLLEDSLRVTNEFVTENADNIEKNKNEFDEFKENVEQNISNLNDFKSSAEQEFSNLTEDVENVLEIVNEIKPTTHHIRIKASMIKWYFTGQEDEYNFGIQPSTIDILVKTETDTLYTKNTFFGDFDTLRDKMMVFGLYRTETIGNLSSFVIPFLSGGTELLISRINSDNSYINIEISLTNISEFSDEII